jgi:hypothetical protein
MEERRFRGSMDDHGEIFGFGGYACRQFSDLPLLEQVALELKIVVYILSQ